MTTYIAGIPETEESTPLLSDGSSETKSAADHNELPTLIKENVEHENDACIFAYTSAFLYRSGTACRGLATICIIFPIFPTILFVYAMWLCTRLSTIHYRMRTTLLKDWAYVDDVNYSFYSVIFYVVAVNTAYFCIVLLLRTWNLTSWIEECCAAFWKVISDCVCARATAVAPHGGLNRDDVAPMTVMPSKVKMVIHNTKVFQESSVIGYYKVFIDDLKNSLYTSPAETVNMNSHELESINGRRTLRLPRAVERPTRNMRIEVFASATLDAPAQSLGAAAYILEHRCFDRADKEWVSILHRDQPTKVLASMLISFEYGRYFPFDNYEVHNACNEISMGWITLSLIVLITTLLIIMVLTLFATQAIAFVVFFVGSMAWLAKQICDGDGSDDDLSAVLKILVNIYWLFDRIGIHIDDTESYASDFCVSSDKIYTDSVTLLIIFSQLILVQSAMVANIIDHHRTGRMTFTYTVLKRECSRLKYALRLYSQIRKPKPSPDTTLISRRATLAT